MDIRSYLNKTINITTYKILPSQIFKGGQEISKGGGGANGRNPVSVCAEIQV